ncbi:glycoside hydrolase family 15 [Phocaeicola barnesiae]|uniref:glycoside hydrolase family 15 n=1 Tax=Phocaeicola barnesiae TaxID=376804 RepID=UPI0025A34704|nr:glycoside hydrolase family 15 [Phocaeicola barnesiae]MDM8242229.1 glycoside hydrolase family 15 [Phocaeicola barnesiae]
MSDILNNIDYIDKDDRIIDVWGRRNPKFEKHYEQSVLRVLSDYGIGASENTDAKGKVLGAGYEPYIIAFFIGLYSDKKLPLSDDSDSTKVLGQPIDKWGNLDSKKFRKAYPKLREYIFMALVAKTPIDWISLDKGEIKVSEVVTKLVKTMEEYANYGFSVMEDKLANDKGYFFSKRAFLDIIMELTDKRELELEDIEAEPL